MKYIIIAHNEKLVPFLFPDCIDALTFYSALTVCQYSSLHPRRLMSFGTYDMLTRTPVPDSQLDDVLTRLRRDDQVIRNCDSIKL